MIVKEGRLVTSYTKGYYVVKEVIGGAHGAHVMSSKVLNAKLAKSSGKDSCSKVYVELVTKESIDELEKTYIDGIARLRALYEKHNG